MKKIIHVSVFFISSSASLLLSLLIGSLLFYSYAHAETYVPSNISSSTTWMLSESPYVVQGVVQLQKNATLTIEPGVQVKFKTSADGFRTALVVYGTLNVKGTAAQPVDFSSYGAEDDWNVPFINSTSTLSHLNISGARQAIFGMDSDIKIDHLKATDLAGTALMFNNSKANISSSIFSNGTSMIELYNKSTGNLSDSLFHGVSANYTGIISVYNQSSLNIENVSMNDISSEGWGSAIAIYTFSTSTISSSTVSNGEGNGIEVHNNSFLSLKDVSITEHKKVGMVAYLNAKVFAENTSINNNDIGLEIDTGPVNMEFISSSIADNREGVANYSGENFKIENVWWGDATGPKKNSDNPTGVGNIVSDDVIVTPWLSKNPFVLTPKCCSNIAFIPGLEASRLYIPSLFGENQLWEPNRNDDVRKLYMDEAGKSIRNDVYTKDIIDESKIGALNIYKTFIQSMDGLVATKVINKWKILPYDWRKDIDDVVLDGTTIKNEQNNFEVLNLVKEIENLASNSTTGKVSIIAHSNGGLVSKILVQELIKKGEVDLIDKVILVAVPELGTPKSIPALLHGYDQSFGLGYVLNEATARGLGQNMQSVYNLLPSKEYFNRVKDPVVEFDSSIFNTVGFNSILAKNDQIINSFDQLQTYLLGQKDSRTNPEIYETEKPIVANKALLSSSASTHFTLDSWQYPENISVSQVVGWGLDTLSATKYIVKDDCTTKTGNCEKFVDAEPIFTSDGDNTVVASSASALNAKTYYVNLPKHNLQLISLRRNRGHADILEITDIQQLIKNIVTHTDNSIVDISNLNLISVTKPMGSGQKNIYISVHSPVSLDVYDKEGNHTGIIQNLDSTSDVELVEENIPNSFYMKFGEGKYAGMPASDVRNISLQGQGYGTFTLVINGSSTTPLTFTDIPVTPASKAIVDLTTNAITTLDLDLNGDGTKDFEVKQNDKFDPVLYLQAVKQIVISLELKKPIEKEIIAKIDVILKLIEKGKISKVESKIKKIMLMMEQRKSKKIDDSDKEQILYSLNQLLSNLK